MAKSLHLLSIPFEATTSFLKGTREGPEAIVRQLGSTTYKNTSILEKDALSLESAAHDICLRILEARDFPLGLGGEHTVSLGLIRASREFSQIGIVQLDAHADLREEYEGNPFSHACVMRRAAEQGVPVLGIGIRAMCEEEAEYVASRSDINLVYGREAVFSSDWYSLVDNLPSNIYLTIDMDVFDPFIVPGVGTPEPGGMSLGAVNDFLKHLSNNKNVIAADVVELCPWEGDENSVRIAADLVRLIETLFL